MLWSRENSIIRSIGVKLKPAEVVCSVISLKAQCIIMKPRGLMLRL